MVHTLARRQRLDHRPAPRRLSHQPGLVEQLVALQHELLIPSLLVRSECGLDAMRALPPDGWVGCLAHPSPQARQDRSRDHCGRPITPVLPRKVPIPVVPARALLSRYAGLPGETEIADRDQALVAAPMQAIPIGEGVELFEVAQRVVRLVLHPGAYAHLQAAMPRGERACRQRPPVLNREHAWLLVRDRDQNRRQFDRLQLRLRADARHHETTAGVCDPRWHIRACRGPIQVRRAAGPHNPAETARLRPYVSPMSTVGHWEFISSGLPGYFASYLSREPIVTDDARDYAVRDARFTNARKVQLDPPAR